MLTKRPAKQPYGHEHHLQACLAAAGHSIVSTLAALCLPAHHEICCYRFLSYHTSSKAYILLVM